MTAGTAVFAHIVKHPAVIAALAILALSLTALGAVAAFVWHPAHIEAADAAAKLERLGAEIRELRYRAKLAQNYTLRIGQAKALENKLLKGKSEPAFVHDIEALATTSGAKVEQVSSRSEEKSGAISTAFFELILKGRYVNIRQFIAGLPELKEFISIERVSFERDAEAIRAYLVLKRRSEAE